jgi:anthranilate synthase component 2
MILIIDNYDSFVYNIYHLFATQYNEKIIVVRNDKITLAEIKKLSPNAIIISPGPCTPNEAGICLNLVKEFYQILPILGICLGHQTIIQALGGKIVKTYPPVHGKSSIISIVKNDDLIFQSISKEFSAIRYHSLIAEQSSLPNEFDITSVTKDDNIIMSVTHKKCNLYGLQFHPESIGTEHSKIFARNFLSTINKKISKLT